MRTVYTLQGKQFKKHKILLAEFNKGIVATEIFPRTIKTNRDIINNYVETSAYVMKGDENIE